MNIGNKNRCHVPMADNIIEVHPLTEDPTKAWTQISKNQKFVTVDLATPSTPPDPGKVRIVCMSDTHCCQNIPFEVPHGDIFVHAGDFTMVGLNAEVETFNRWLMTLPHKYKVVISGNHELGFDENSDVFHFTDNIKNKKECLKDCIYLEDSEVTLFGLKFYGSPWQPEYRCRAFNLPRGEKLLSKWNLIPEDTDILITHGPPLGRGDLLPSGKRAGCLELLTTVQQRVKPKYHIFGHIHEGYGVSSDGTTTYINAATCNNSYVPKNPPIVFDVSVPYGYSIDRPSNFSANKKHDCNVT